MTGDPPHRRTHPRRAVTLSAVCRTQGGLRDDCQISDISPRGCCIHTRRLHVNIGARVMVRPKGLEGVTGIVRWINGHLVGVEFDMPLYEPVVDHLARTHAAGETVAVARR